MVDNVKADGVFIETPNRFGIVESNVEYREQTSKRARLLGWGGGKISDVLSYRSRCAEQCSLPVQVTTCAYRPMLCKILSTSA